MFFLFLFLFLFFFYLPQQSSPSQNPVSDSGPGHGVPQSLGGGLLHVRDLDLTPDPHEAEHEDHGAHGDQLPSTRTVDIRTDN
jgi:hypothetical protein